MASDWESTTIGQLVQDLGGSIKTGPFGTALKASEYVTTGVPLISVREVGYGRIVIDGSTPRVSPATTSRLAEYILNHEDIVFGRKGAIDRSALVKKDEEGWFLGSDGIRLRLPTGLNRKFVSYVLRGQGTRNWLFQHSTGTTMASLNQGTIAQIPILVPSRSTQDAIAHILGTLDDKIELLRQMNETLEAIARALFKSWFVDFDPVRKKADGLPTGLPKEIEDLFPSEFEDSELGEIPKGWNASVTSAIYKVTIGKTPPRKEAKWFSISENDIPWISIKDMGNASVYVKDASEYLTVEAVERFNVVRIPQDTVVVSFKLTVGRVAITQRAMLSNEAIAHFLRKADTYLSSEFLYCYLKSYDFGELGSTSSIGTAVNSESIRSIKILVPDPEVHSVFFDNSKYVFHQIAQNLNQLQVLTKIRDSLLPNLISGDLELTDDIITQILEPAK